MSETQNSFSELIENFVLLQNNAITIIQKINEAVVSDIETISFTLEDMEGKETTYHLPSFKYIKQNFDRIDETLKSLMGLENESIIKMSDGSFKKIYTTKLINEPEDIKSLNIPATFNVKSNWFFESFLNPLLYINFDVSKYISQSSKKILCKRVILLTDTLDKQNYFDLNYKGQNNIDINAFIKDIYSKGIIFHEDEEIKDLPLSILQSSGSFDVIDIKDIEITNISGKQIITRQYTLNTLSYFDNITRLQNKELKIGDKIVFKESMYEITSVNSSINAITLKRISGYDAITMGVDILKIYSNTFAPKVAEVAIGFDERQVIFFKSIDDVNNTISQNWSPGVGIYSNDLSIETTGGTQTLKQFYNTNVIDFSRTIMSIAKEKTIPSIYGEIPSPPILIEPNFKVLQINTQLFNSKEEEEIKKKGSDKINLESEIKNIDDSIEKTKQILGNTQFKTIQERNAVKNKLDSLIREKTIKTSLYTSIIKELVAIAQDSNITLDKPKYRIRGFFEIPAPKYNDYTGDQEIIQFEYAYRYLRIDEKPAEAIQLEFSGEDNQIKRGTYSPWVSVKSDIRKKEYDYKTGIYIWLKEDIENPDVININQIDIPINKGEKVEIRVRSISEAGWPVNPLTSEWSESIIINFPSELNVINDVEIILKQAFNEQNQIAFEETLLSKNLDLHLSNSTQTGDKYISHEADSIASGFFNDNGLSINLYEKIKSLQSEIVELRNILEKTFGHLKVSIIEDGQTLIKHEIKNGSTIDLFAGYYTDYINQLSSSERKGAIITKVYKLMIENSVRTPLELISEFPGGLDERLLEAVDNTDYSKKLKYYEVPINNLSIASNETSNSGGIYMANSQSRQLKSQYLYLRKKNIGLVNDLYKDDIDRSFGKIEDILEVSSNTQSFIWNFEFDNNDNPKGGGKLTDFCIHKDCPILKKLNNSDWRWDDDSFDLNDPNMIYRFFNTPEIKFDEKTNLPISPMRASAFRHSKYFNLQSSETDGKIQLSFKDNWKYNKETGEPLEISNENFEGGIGEGIYYPKFEDLPDKIGFYTHDRYLIGKNTCGCYLFLSPAFFEQLLVDGTDHRSIRKVNEGEYNAIIIPIVFQFRMVDYYGDTNTSGKIGGDTSNNLTNIIYGKKIGIDLYTKNESRFSFDINVSAKYTRTSHSEISEVASNITQKHTTLAVNKSSITSQQKLRNS